MSGDARESPPHHAYRPARSSKTSDPAPAQSTAPARSYPRPEVRQSKESAPSYPASNAAPTDNPECGPSPSSSHSGLRPKSPWPSKYPLRSTRSSPTAAQTATLHNSVSGRNQPPSDSSGSGAQVLSANPS